MTDREKGRKEYAKYVLQMAKEYGLYRLALIHDKLDSFLLHVALDKKNPEDWSKWCDERDKRVRAEVSAACIAYLKRCENDWTWRDVLYALENYQPVASDLEELLSRSYRDGATGAAAWFIKLLHGHPEDPPEMGCKPEAISEKLEELLREEREKIAIRLRHVADGYEQGGHTHRAKAFRAIADEFVA